MMDSGCFKDFKIGRGDNTITRMNMIKITTSKLKNRMYIYIPDKDTGKTDMIEFFEKIFVYKGKYLAEI
jgi:hypothetical protein